VEQVFLMAVAVVEESFQATPAGLESAALAVAVLLQLLISMAVKARLAKEMLVALRQEISLGVAPEAVAVVPAALDITQRELDTLRTVVTVEMDLQIQ
jgi:hypothetical protein